MTAEGELPPWTTPAKSSPLFRLPLQLRETTYSFGIEINVTGPASGLWTASELMPVRLYAPEPRAYPICHRLTAELNEYLGHAKSARFLIDDCVNFQE